MEAQIRPAEEATVKLMEAAAAAGVKKFLLTSSIASIFASPVPHPIVSEKYWSDVDFMKANMMNVPQMPYLLAKTLQEKTAWETAKKLNMNLVTLLPAYVFGPGLYNSLNASQELIIALMKGGGAAMDQCAPGKIPDAYAMLVDVRDVAEGHVLALEKDDAEGRYILCSHTVHFKDILDVVRDVVGKDKLPKMDVDKKDVVNNYEFDNSRMTKLGVGMIPWKQTIEENAKTLLTGRFI